MVEAYWEIDPLPLNQDGVPDKQFNAKYVQSFVVGALEGVQVPEPTEIIINIWTPCRADGESPFKTDRLCFIGLSF